MAERPQIPPGGLRCDQILDRLPDYLDDGLSPPERAQVKAHLRTCANCSAFGGAYAAVVQALQADDEVMAP